MEADREVLCDPKGRHQVERSAWRRGSVYSHVTLGGRQVELPQLRVRSADGEVPVASFQWAAATDRLDEHTLAAVAAGVSTRRYASTLDLVPCDVTERATSSSAVVAAVRGAVDKAPPGVSRPAVWGSGPAGGLHRREGLPCSTYDTRWLLPVRVPDVPSRKSARVAGDLPSDFPRETSRNPKRKQAGAVPGCPRLGAG